SRGALLRECFGPATPPARRKQSSTQRKPPPDPGVFLTSAEGRGENQTTLRRNTRVEVAVVALKHQQRGGQTCAARRSCRPPRSLPPSPWRLWRPALREESLQGQVSRDPWLFSSGRVERMGSRCRRSIPGS